MITIGAKSIFQSGSHSSWQLTLMTFFEATLWGRTRLESLGSDGASLYLLPRSTVGLPVPIITLWICVIVMSNLTPFEVF
jgi:hypothetical protein